MPKIAELWAREMEDEISSIERLILAAADRAAALRTDPLLNGQKQSVAALGNHLRKLAEDAANLRRAFRPTSVDFEESVDTGLVERVKAERNGAVDFEESVEPDLVERAKVNAKVKRNGAVRVAN